MIKSRAQETAEYDARQRAKSDAADKARLQSDAARPASWTLNRVMHAGQPALQVLVVNGRAHAALLAELGFVGLVGIRSTDVLTVTTPAQLDAVRPALIAAGIIAGGR